MAISYPSPRILLKVDGEDTIKYLLGGGRHKRCQSLDIWNRSYAVHKNLTYSSL